MFWGFFMMKIFVCYASKVAKLSGGGIHLGAEGKGVRDQDLQLHWCKTLIIISTTTERN